MRRNQHVLKRLPHDGLPKPPDFVSGEDAAELTVMIENLKLEICE